MVHLSERPIIKGQREYLGGDAGEPWKQFCCILSVMSYIIDLPKLIESSSKIHFNHLYRFDCWFMKGTELKRSSLHGCNQQRHCGFDYFVLTADNLVIYYTVLLYRCANRSSEHSAEESNGVHQVSHTNRIAWHWIVPLHLHDIWLKSWEKLPPPPKKKKIHRAWCA